MTYIDSSVQKVSFNQLTTDLLIENSLVSNIKSISNSGYLIYQSFDSKLILDNF